MIDLEKISFFRRTVKLWTELYSIYIMEKQPIQSRASYLPFK